MQIQISERARSSVHISSSSHEPIECAATAINDE